MIALTTPHVSVQLHTSQDACGDGRWRIVLAWSDTERQLVLTDFEPDVQGDRLELLAAVRALEALDEPSQVTLLTASRYVTHGLNYGLDEWRENDWCWERFGELAPIKHRDLWQRVDRALAFHQVECRALPIDGAHATVRISRVARRGASVAKPKGKPSSPSAGRYAERWRSFLADASEQCGKRLRHGREMLAGS